MNSGVYVAYPSKLVHAFFSLRQQLSRTREDWKQPEQRDVRNRIAPGRNIIPATAVTAWVTVSADRVGRSQPGRRGARGEKGGEVRTITQGIFSPLTSVFRYNLRDSDIKDPPPEGKPRSQHTRRNRA